MSNRKESYRKGSFDAWLQQQISSNEICKCCRRELGLIVRNIAMFRGKCQNCRQKICSACVVTNLCHKCRVQKVVNLNPDHLMKLPAKKLIEIATTLHFHNPQGYEKSELVQLILAIYGMKWTRPIPQQPPSAIDPGNPSEALGKCGRCNAEIPLKDIRDGFCKKCDILRISNYQPETLMQLSVKDLLDVLDALKIPRTEVVVREKGELVMLILKKLGKRDDWTPPVPEQPLSRTRLSDCEAPNTSVINNNNSPTGVLPSFSPRETDSHLILDPEEPMDTSAPTDTSEPPGPTLQSPLSALDDTMPSSSSADLNYLVNIHRLEDIPSEDVINDLKIHQLKAILEQWQVDIEGCCEKKDLADQVTILWRDWATSPPHLAEDLGLDAASASGSISDENHSFINSHNQRQDHPATPEPQEMNENDLSHPPNGEHFDSSEVGGKEGHPHIMLAGEVPPLKSFNSENDIDALSVRQLKAVLQKNSVDYSLCREREELATLAKQLWMEANKWKTSDNIPYEDVCKICMDAAIDCVLLECGHMVACTECGRQMSECPVCRQFVTRVVHTFKA